MRSTIDTTSPFTDVSRVWVCVTPWYVNPHLQYCTQQNVRSHSFCRLWTPLLAAFRYNSHGFSCRFSSSVFIGWLWSTFYAKRPIESISRIVCNSRQVAPRCVINLTRTELTLCSWQNSDEIWQHSWFRRVYRVGYQIQLRLFWPPRSINRSPIYTVSRQHRMHWSGFSLR